MGKFIVGITGASGSIYGKRVVEELLRSGHVVFLTITRSGMVVMEEELGLRLGKDAKEVKVVFYLTLILQ